MRVIVSLVLATGLMGTRAIAAPVAVDTGKRICDVQHYGAKADGATLDTAAIQKAIDDCAGKGGGIVRLAGAAKFISAPLNLKSHVTLEITEGTTLEASTNHDDFPEIEQFHDKGRQSLLSAKDAEDIAIRGGGVIDGRGESWWPHRGPGDTRPRLIVFDHCKHVLMENVTVQNSPSWQIMPYYSEDLTFRNMKILAPLPPRRPADLVGLAFADAPMPPTRPADLILASKTDQSGGAVVPPANKGFGPAAPHGWLPQVITSGVDRAPTGALALIEAPSAGKYDDDALLARAAELTAPLPPMPIPGAAVAAAGPSPTLVAAASPPQAEHGWVARTAAVAAEDIAQVFGGVFKRSASAQTSSDELRASQQ